MEDDTVLHCTACNNFLVLLLCRRLEELQEKAIISGYVKQSGSRVNSINWHHYIICNHRLSTERYRVCWVRENPFLPRNWSGVADHYQIVRRVQQIEVGYYIIQFQKWSLEHRKFDGRTLTTSFQISCLFNRKFGLLNSTASWGEGKQNGEKA